VVPTPTTAPEDYGPDGVDNSLIRMHLDMTVEQRIACLQAMLDFALESHVVR
jgi:hypothetical protein